MPTSFLQQMGVRSLVDLARRRARETPERAAYTWLDGGREADRLTYRELDRRARALAAALADGTPPGERALLLFPPGLDFVVAFLGCLYAGVAAVPAYPPRRNRGMERLDAIVADTRPRWVLAPEKLTSRIGSWIEASGLTGSAAPRVLAADGLDPGLADGWSDPGVGPDTLAFLQYTSGSTSSPKGVRVAHRHLLHNEEMIRRAFGQSPDSVIVSWLPLYHDMGLIGGVLQPLYLGARCILMSPFGFLQNPRSWLEAITTYRATTSGGPDFGYNLCVRKIGPEAREGLDLSSWSVAFNGSEPVRSETLDAFTEAFAPHGFRRRCHYPCYGLAEATLFVTGGSVDEPPPVSEVSSSALERHRVEPATGDADRRRLVACGRAWSGQKVVVADPETRRRLPEGSVGEIWISGPSVADGYWNRPDRTEEEFRARLAEEDGEPADRWLRTGDLGFLDGSELFVTGRLKDLIILRGRNYYPHDFERTAEAVHRALRPGCGAAFSVETGGEERLVLVQEVDPRFARRRDAERIAELAEAVRRAVAEEHEVAVHEVVLVAAGQVPKTSSGKVRRSRCSRRYGDDALEVLARTGTAQPVAGPDSVAPAPAVTGGLDLDRADLEFLDDDERLPILKLHLRRAVAETLKLPPETVDARTPLTALGLDSLAAMELVHMVEASLELELPLAELLEGPTLGELSRSLLDQLAAGARAEPEAALGTPSPEPSDPFPLSYGQRALWFLHRLAPDSSAYHIAAAFTVPRGFSRDAFEAACRALVRRHPALRTTFHAPADLAGEPTQRVHPEGSPDWAVGDVSAWDAERIRRHLAAETAEPFDLESGPLFRVRVLTTAEGGATVLVVLHHVVADFWSMGLLARDLDRLLSGQDLAPPATAYAAHVNAERRRLGGETGERLWRFWEDRLAGASAELELPTDRPRPRVRTHAGAAWRRTLPAELAAGLRSLARSRGATPFVTLLAVFTAALHRWSGQADLTVGSPTAGREDRRFAATVGYFVNPVALRSRVAGDPAFVDHVDATRRRVTEALEHAGLPLPLLAERLRPERDASRSPLFQAMFVHHRAAMAGEDALAALAVGRDGVAFRLGEMDAVSRTVPDRSAQLDVTLAVAEVGDDLHATLTYSTDLFDATTARRLLRTVETLARGAVARPEGALSSLPLHTPAEWAQVVREWSTVPAVAVDGRTLIRRVLDQAAATPQARALLVGEESSTYGELAARAGRVAEALGARGVGPEDRVGVLLPRTADLVAALLGIWGAGGAYVPVDPGYPEERKRFMLEDSGARWVVTDAERAGELGDAEAILVEELPEPEAPPQTARVDSEHLAYVIYTSGSTGHPKGVAIEHAGAAALVDWARSVFSPDELRGVLAATSVCFDLSVFELFLPLATGGTVILADQALSLADLPSRHEVTLVNTVPSAAAELLAANALPSSVKTVNLAGEALQGALAERVYATGTVERLYNLYGPSEDTTYSTVSRVPRSSAAGSEPTIGRPVAGTRAYVLDASGRPTPVGIPGELCLAGAGLARGYLGRPSKTAEGWVPDPFGPPGSRLYRTGDRVRWLPPGELEFLGRFDHQVKLRGFRIELGEVETALTSLPGVAEAVVGVRDGSLAAFVVPEEPPADRAELFQDLRHAVAARLPSYMVPALGAVLAEMPRTPNGKVDRKALASLDVTSPGEASAGAGRAPTTETERILADLWGRVLDRPPVAADQDVFALGAHSLMATRVASRLPEELGVELPLSAFFEAHTVAEQAARVEAARGVEPAGDETAPPLVPASREGDLPLSYAQERLWFLERLEPGSAVYHVAEALDLDGDLSAPALGAALDELVRRHESLRTVLPERDGAPRQEVLDPAPVPYPVLDLSRLTTEDRETALERSARRAARRPFDLLAGPVFRTVLARVEPDRHSLWVNLHHVVTDGWSLGILARELKALYGAARGGRPSPLPEPTLQYADYAVWQRRVLTPDALGRRVDAWRERLAGAPPVLELPTDRPRPAEASPAGDRVELSVPADLANRLVPLARREGTPFMALLAAWATLLSRLARQTDLVVGTPVAHRTRPELEEIPGFFVNTLALRLDLAGRPGFAELLARVRRLAVDAFETQDLPFEVLVQELAPERSLAASPLFQAFFVVQNAPLEPLELPGLVLTRKPVATGTTHFDLSMELTDAGDGLTGFVEYRRDLFDRTTVVRWVGHFRRLLEAAVGEPERPVTTLPWLGEVERYQVTTAWGAAPSPASEAMERPLHRRFEDQARRTPDRVAVEHGDLHLTYASLDRASGVLARRLRRLGVGPDVAVGVRLPRGPDRIVAVLAVARSGGACLPLDPSYPDHRLALMTADAGAPVTVTDAWVREPGDGEPMEETVPVPADALLYLIYTSGSTGRPKGVALPHRALANLMAWQDRQWTGGGAARTLQLAPMSFDVFFQELYATLGTGGVLVLVDDDLRRDAEALWTHIVERRVERLFLPFVALAGLAEAAESAGADRGPEASALADVATAGEQLRSTPPVRSLFARSGARLVNQYGPSEAHVVSAHDLERDPDLWPPLPGIGRPVDGVELRVLDGEGEAAPPGVAGELGIAGVCLARGYLGRPARTALAFVPDAAAGRPGARVYRTGDLARWTARGELEFLGRADDQVKIRGHRVEPGEAETVLAAAPGVRDTVVAVRGDGARRRLVAWVTAEDGSSPPTADELRGHLGESLPEYMIPSVFSVLDAFPLTPSGKVDRRRLPEPEAPAVEAGEAPRTPAEGLVADVFRELLEIDAVGRRDSFFDLGGHSLLATRAVARLRVRFGVEVAVKTLFAHPTVTGLARELTSTRGDGTKPAAAPPPLERCHPGSEPVPSFAQERMWFLDRLASGTDPFARAAYNLSGGFRVRTALSGPALVQSLAGLSARHAVLRTRFEDAGGRLRLRLEPAAPRATVPVVDLSGLAGPHRRGEARRLARWEALTCFDLSRPPLMRARQLVLDADDRVLCVSVHHAAADGWSLGLAVRDVGGLYQAASAGRPLPVEPSSPSYADYAAWQRRWIGDGGMDAALEAWEARLQGLEPLDLPTDRPRTGEVSFRGGERVLRWPPFLVERVDDLARHAGATRFMVLMAAFQTLLARWSGQADLAVGTPVAGRTLAELEGAVGCFVNTLVLRSRVAGSGSFDDLLGRVREAALEAFALQDVPFERLVERLRPERDPRVSPLFQAFLALENTPRQAGTLAGVPLEEIRGPRRTTRFDLTLALREVDGALVGGLNYRTALFDATTVERFVRQLEGLLEAVLHRPEAPLESLDVLAPGERHAVLHEGVSEDVAADEVCDPYEAFARQAARRPDAVALVAGRRETLHLTYGALDDWTARVAGRLGSLPGPEPRVGVLLERSPVLVAALLALWRAGAVYVPLDPSHPVEQLRLRAEDAGPAAILTRPEHRETARALAGETVPVIPADRGGRGAMPPRPVDRLQLGHVFYTSGSTGRPKGVAVSRGALARHLAGIRRRYRLRPGERMLQFAAPSFDASLNQMLGPVTCGACTVLAEAGVPDPLDLGRRLAEEAVTRINVPPAYFERLVANAERIGALPAAALWISGGDRLPPEAAARFRTSPWGAARLFNGYGPTEGAVTATLHPVSRAAADGTPVPIGRPFPGRRLVVLDPSGRPAPVGVFGELCLADPTLARGYLGRPGRTAEVFVPDPQGDPGSRLYRTGDRVRWLASGHLEIRGRFDRQVQIRGFRVEPGEVEAVLSAHAAVRQAAVEVRTGPAGDPRLVAFVVAAEAAPEEPEAALRAHLGERLPSYMQPAAYRFLDHLPRTSGGKVGRRALARLEVTWGGDRSVSFTAPRSATESRVVRVFEDLLGAERVGVHDDFFHLGGHSLLATQAVSRVREGLGVEVPLRRFFETPTAAELAAWIDERDATVAEAIEPRGEDGPAPLSFAQERLWILDRLEPGNAAYNVPAAVRLTGRLGSAAWDGALLEVVRRHEILRTVFATRDGRPVQIVRPDAGPALPRVDLSGLAPEDREAAADRLFAREASRPFDLARGPLVRFVRLPASAGEQVFLLDLHHVVTDGWSMGLLMREVAAHYGAYLEGRPSPLPEPAVQYADYAVWQRRWLTGERLERQLRFWRETLAGAPPGLDLPTDRPRPAVRSFRGAWRRLELPRDLTEDLRQLSRRQRASLFMTLLAAFTVLLSRWAGEEDVLVGSPVAGRTRGETEDLLGFFLNTLVLRADLTGEPPFRRLLERVRESALAAYEHQDLPFERLLEELEVPRELSRTPLFSVFFNLVNVPFGRETLPGLEMEPLRSPDALSKFDMTLYVRELSGADDGAAGGLALDLAYDAHLFSAERMDALLDQYRFLLEQVVEDPERPVFTYSLVSGDQVVRLPDPEAHLDDLWRGSVPELFLEQARHIPEAEAVCDPAGSWTYGDLERASARVARKLADSGVAGEDPVAVWAHRSAVLVPAVLGILRSGGAFVMLDPAYPASRLARMVELARPRAFLHLTAAGELPAELTQILAGPGGCPVLELPAWTEWGSRADAEAAAPDVPVGPEDLAYVSFTSGSTGRPKGILGRHGPLTHFLPWQAERFGLGPGDRYSLLSGLAHDPLQRDLFTALCLGGTVVVPDPAEIFAAGRLAIWMRRQEVTVAHLTPAMGQVLAETGPDGPVTVPSLRWVLLVGDALTRRDVARLERLGPRARCVNLYGSTETQRAVGHHVIERGGGGEDKEILPLGRGMPAVQLLVVNAAGHRAGVGELGEIAVRSPHLARGYLDDPERTRERFTPNPWSDDPADRLYRTGDLGRYRPDGEVVFAGRADTQVQVRGFRIELSEIEGELGRLDGVREAVVLAKGQAADRWLVAWVVPDPDRRIDVAGLRRALAERLPGYMVPAVFVPLDALPLTPNGKVDRRALAARDDTPTEVDAMHRDPETDTERLIARLIGEALDVERIGIDDNFFDMGANSLLLVQVHGRLEEALERKIPAVDLFSHPTVRELAAHLAPHDGADAAASETTPDRSERLKAGRARLAARRRKRK